MEKLGLVVFKSSEDLGLKVNKELKRIYKTKDDFIIPIKENFFDDGHLKVEIESSIRGMNLFFLTDVGNYSIEYNMRGVINHTSPNDLMTELFDGIGACNCHARNINVVMPLLYAGRQHRRNTRESLACGSNLRRLDSISKMKSLITFDAHDEGVEHAICNMEFDNFYATNVILEEFINDLSCDDLKNLVFVAPDNGATGRRNVYLNSFNSPYIKRSAGSFIKQRDYNHLVDGKYPVIAHEYTGSSVKNMTAIVVDDMISSGGSMFDVLDELYKRGTKKIYIIVTYALFTKGIDKFKEYYDKGILSGIYTTNLSYIPKKFKKEEWLHVCDCSKLIAEIIYNIHNDLSISKLLSDKSLPIKLLDDKFKEC